MLAFSHCTCLCWLLPVQATSFRWDNKFRNCKTVCQTVRLIFDWTSLLVLQQCKCGTMIQNSLELKCKSWEDTMQVVRDMIEQNPSLAKQLLVSVVSWNNWLFSSLNGCLHQPCTSKLNFSLYSLFLQPMIRLLLLPCCNWLIKTGSNLNNRLSRFPLPLFIALSPAALCWYTVRCYLSLPLLLL